MLKDGYTDIAPGKIAAVVTYLAMTAPPVDLERPALDLAPLRGDPARYRALFRRVGEPWLWFGRAGLSDDALARIIDDPAVEAYALRHDGADAGLLELDFRNPGECELGYFGLVPEATGRGLGRSLMREAIARAFARPIGRFFVHTCTLDDPRALPFYIRAGFRPYKRAIEVADDPRLAGALPMEAAPHCPVLPPQD
ncbi:GNAT family N-acetyltransferase [Salinarimonas soli]|uniref:GNAT family N-acetyltransferase n=1 Tax=Salinarimonas soli TaxID=1638099 RepID=A0A5B2VB00_9HYPH|nr:GNAT family N-acetyltransferase [Salinarimonas soli]KAA2235785.1 GNAT family N-acetyltransferase [Salinarimonas soli]